MKVQFNTHKIDMDESINDEIANDNAINEGIET